MKHWKIIIYFAAIITIIIANSTYVFSQTADIGFGAIRYSQKGMLISTYDPGSETGNVNEQSKINEAEAIPSLIFSYYYPFYKPTDYLSVGGLSGLSFYTFYNKKDDPTNLSGQTIGTGSSSGFYVGYQIPLYASVRLFNSSNKDNLEGFGGGLGIGYVAHGFTIDNEKGFMFSPSFLAEIRFNKVGLKFETLFNKFTSVYKSDTGDIPRLETSFFQIHLFLIID
ncbi:MAG: hypothetical protein K0B10_09295 [Vicingaceae bacterium]|nr:hypothetical protein [Vicingaceae bacterium]